MNFGSSSSCYPESKLLFIGIASVLLTCLYNTINICIITLWLAIILNGNELEAGMYIYSLISDGAEIDTKRMILTD